LSWSSGESSAYLEEFVKNDKERGFDLTRDILTRVSLFKTAPETYTLVWSFHHILMDGWCLGILYKESLQIYRRLKQGKSLELRPVVPYVNYIKWLEKQDQKAGLPKSKPARQVGNDAYQPGEYILPMDEKEVYGLNSTAAGRRKYRASKIWWDCLLILFQLG
jgi:hypothetical protein